MLVGGFGGVLSPSDPSYDGFRCRNDVIIEINRYCIYYHYSPMSNIQIDQNVNYSIRWMNNKLKKIKYDDDSKTLLYVFTFLYLLWFGLYVLFCPLLSYLVPSYLVLSCSVLCCLVLSCVYSDARCGSTTELCGRYLLTLNSLLELGSDSPFSVKG